MKGWMMLVTGPDTEIGENLRRRIVAAAISDSDEAFRCPRYSPWGYANVCWPTDGRYCR